MTRHWKEPNLWMVFQKSKQLLLLLSSSFKIPHASMWMSKNCLSSCNNLVFRRNRASHCVVHTKMHVPSLYNSVNHKHSSVSQSFNHSYTHYAVPQLDRLKWRVDFVLASSKLMDVNEPAVEIALEINDQHSADKKKQEIFEVSAEKFRTLFHGMCIYKCSSIHNTCFKIWKQREKWCSS